MRITLSLGPSPPRQPHQRIPSCRHTLYAKKESACRECATSVTVLLGSQAAATNSLAAESTSIESTAYWTDWECITCVPNILPQPTTDCEYVTGAVSPYLQRRITCASAPQTALPQIEHRLAGADQPAPVPIPAAHQPLQLGGVFEGMHTLPVVLRAGRQPARAPRGGAVRVPRQGETASWHLASGWGRSWLRVDLWWGDGQAG